MASRLGQLAKSYVSLVKVEHEPNIRCTSDEWHFGAESDVAFLVSLGGELPFAARFTNDR